MNRKALGCLLLLAALAGCSSRYVDFTPDEEAIYDQPLDEVWPLVRAYFRDNGFNVREDLGRASLETEWREEFAGSRVAAYWHRYLVVAVPEGPHHSKVIVTRDSRSANKALRPPGADLLWTVDGRTPDNPSGLGSDTSTFLAMQQADNSATILGESGQSARDTTLEWKIFRKLSPVLASSAKKSGASPDVAVLKDASIECGVPILGLGKLARAGNVLLLGELHGTQQVPHFVAQSACQIATQGMPVTVGLEVPDVNQARLEAFVASAGGSWDWAKLMESPFWRSPYPDGRNSEAVAYLLEALRKLRSQGLDVSVFAYDRPPLEGEAREEVMARTVLRGGPALLQAGDAGAQRQPAPASGQGPAVERGLQAHGVARGRPARARVLAGHRLQERHGVDLLARGGPEARLWREAGAGQGQRGSLLRAALRWPQSQGFQGIFYVGEVSASLPAVYHGVEPAGESHPVAPIPGR